MRESTIYNMLNEHKKKIGQIIGSNLNIFAHGILDLAIYRETWEAIIFNRKRLFWFIILWLWKPIKAQDYFTKIYTKIKATKFTKEIK